jgi:hypothetical protein
LEPPQRQQPGGKKNPVSPPSSDRGSQRNAGGQQASNWNPAPRRNPNCIGQHSCPSQSQTRRDLVLNRNVIQHHNLRPETRQPEYRVPAPRHDSDCPRRALDRRPIPASRLLRLRRRTKDSYQSIGSAVLRVVQNRVPLQGLDIEGRVWLGFTRSIKHEIDLVPITPQGRTTSRFGTFGVNFLITNS